MHKGSRINNLCIQAPRFGSDLADTTEQNPRRSIAMFSTLKICDFSGTPSGILRLRIGQRWRKSVMHRCTSYLFASPRFLSLLFILILVPGLLSAQDIIRTSRYDRTGMSTNSSDKIDVLRKRYSIPSRSSIISPSFGDDIILVVCRTDLGLTAYYMLFKKEPVIIGEHAYSFDVYGTQYQIHYVKNGSIITKVISANEVFLSQDNYMLKVWGPKRHE